MKTLKYPELPVKEGDEFAEDEIDICWVSYDVEGKGSFSLVVLTVR